VEELVDLAGLRELLELKLGGLGELLLDDLVAEIDALVADVHAGAGDELLHLLLRLSAERALQEIRVPELRHRAPVTRSGLQGPYLTSLPPQRQQARAAISSPRMPRR